jgi:hypothetical protein
MALIVSWSEVNLEIPRKANHVDEIEIGFIKKKLGISMNLSLHYYVYPRSPNLHPLEIDEQND